MPRKNHIHEDQEQLFEPQSTPEDREYMSSIGRRLPVEERGISVNISERAERLKASLDAMGKLNQRIGFDYAASTRPLSDEIWGRYHSETPRVVEGARNKAEELREEVRQNFWHATGYAALRNTTLMKEPEIAARSLKDWSDFIRSFSHPRDVKQREEFKRHLKKVIRQANKPSQDIAA